MQRERGFDRHQLATAHTSQDTCRPCYDQSPVLQHPMAMHSAMQEVMQEEPYFTSCHDKFFGTVDYIWYTQQASLPMLQ